ncbi:hypothetical protein NOR_03731 [Metarhizium rileyi]|uniref:Uncharacterized protein n=1 Tax=Metarhizium rileyi (strain RCEF 4871) TaxID=1649241 RepID=A0A167F9W8_METRR|nr:hypothetical protein NOR_03731 [Metarhizium rileyi RCEF 4871]
MTKLTSDAFLPSGAIDIPINGSIGGPMSRSGFDASQPKSIMLYPGDAFNNGDGKPARRVLISSPSRNTAAQGSPINPPAAARLTSNLPLAGRPLDSPSPLNLSNSLSPVGVTRPADSARGKGGGFVHPSISSLSPPAAWGIGGATLARSVSADAAVPHHTPSRHCSGLATHSSLVENWRLERSNLEALRQKAEKLYRGQQSVIDEMSEEWLKERSEMSQLIQNLRERVQRLEGENTVLKTIASYAAHVPGLISPHNSLQSGSGGAYSSHSPSVSSNKSPPPRPSGPFGRTASETSASFDLPPGLDTASRRPRHFANQGCSPCISPSALPTNGLYTPLSPRKEPRKSIATDFLSSSSPEPTGNVPIIDVQEIDPKLEGIPIRATAVQKPTFHPVPDPPGNVSSPPRSPKPATGICNDNRQKQTPGVSIRGKLRIDRRRSGLSPLVSSKDQTKQILATDESRRLTMHAGHTPNHSLSLFPTMTATESSSAAARSQETTPTACTSSMFAEQHKNTDTGDVEDGKLGHGKADRDETSHLDGELNDDIKCYLEPLDDVPLKGPLMIKNIPAQDEIFWARVNQKLDPISRGQDALPKVLQSPELEAVTHPPGVDQPLPRDGENPEETSADMGSDDGGENGKANVEPDVPLKFKSTTNFGAPFGAV